MNNKILLNHPDAVFMPYISSEPEMPCYYSFYSRVTRLGPCQCNFHKNIEIFYLMHGETDMLYEDKIISLHAGDTMVINRYCVHQLIMKEPIGYLSIIIDDNFCKQNKIDVNRLHFSEVIRDSYLNSSLEKIIEEQRHHQPFRFTAIRLALLEVLLYLCRNYCTEASKQQLTSDAGWKYISDSIEYIKENLAKKLCVDDVAASVGLSKFHFIREFKRLTGYTLTSYINIIRCEYAKELLQHGQHKIKEVAFLCGFENESYFTAVFKRCVGILPSQYIRTTSLEKEQGN